MVRARAQVGIRASDHCRVAVAAAKAQLLARWLQPSGSVAALDAGEVSGGLASLARDAARCVAETRLRRDSPEVLFGER